MHMQQCPPLYTPPMLLGQETQRAELNEKLYEGQREEEKLYISDKSRVAYRRLSLVCAEIKAEKTHNDNTGP